MSLILTDSKDAIGTIVLNHAAKRNALSKALIAEVTAALERFRERAVTGRRAACTGGLQSLVCRPRH